MNRGLYFASTPMIALVAAGAALAQGGPARLVLLEDFDLAERFEALLRGWRDNPFEDIVRLPGRYTEHARGAPDRARGFHAFVHRNRVKRALRGETLVAIAALDAAFLPDALWLGNDRKVETQYALHLAATRSGNPTPGNYLDDGLYTYLGDVRQRPWVRRKDWLVKQVAYGRWWQRSSQAGTTSWIGQAWLAFPEWAPDCYRHVQALPRAWFANRAMLRLSADAARMFEMPHGLARRCAGVLVLPHSNQLLANPALADALRQTLRAAADAGTPLALKYHPREVDPDPAGLVGAGAVLVLPALLPMELLLPLLPSGARLIGEGSTVLLAARWLRPDLRIGDLGVSSDGYAARARQLFAQVRIPVA